MIEQTITRAQARTIYDRLGAGLDRMERFEAQAKALALDLLGLSGGQQVLHLGVGVGAEHAAIRAAVAPGGQAVGLDLSLDMLRLARARADTPLSQADAAALPFGDQRFDRLFAAYLLDLLPSADLPGVLAECRRVLRPGGKLALVSLTEGVDFRSRAFVAGWKLLYRLSPRYLGGCRPLQLTGLLQAAGFAVERRAVVVQRSFPSEVVVASLQHTVD